MTSITKYVVERSKNLEYLYMIEVISLKLIVNYKMFYVNPMVTTKKILIEDIQKKIRKKQKHVTTKTSMK